jgi:hypothetical protein
MLQKKMLEDMNHFNCCLLGLGNVQKYSSKVNTPEDDFIDVMARKDEVRFNTARLKEK